MPTSNTPKAQIDFEANALNEFKYHLDKAIEAMYDARMENNVAVLTLPIKELYRELEK